MLTWRQQSNTHFSRITNKRITCHKQDKSFHHFVHIYIHFLLCSSHVHPKWFIKLLNGFQKKDACKDISDYPSPDSRLQNSIQGFVVAMFSTCMRKTLWWNKLITESLTHFKKLYDFLFPIFATYAVSIHKYVFR